MVIRRTGGFTLIELTLAALLLSIGLLALAGALAHSLSATARTRAAHAALREAAGSADSVAAAATFTPGARRSGEIYVWWEPASCGAAECVRVSVAVAGDTLTLLSARRAVE